MVGRGICICRQMQNSSNQKPSVVRKAKRRTRPTAIASQRWRYAVRGGKLGAVGGGAALGGGAADERDSGDRQEGDGEADGGGDGEVFGIGLGD